MAPETYYPVFIYSLAVITVLVGAQYVSSGSNVLYEEGSKNYLIPIALCVVLVLWLGARPIHWRFGDTVNYSVTYAALDSGSETIDWSHEGGWQFLVITCHSMGLGIHDFFKVVEALYFFTMLVAIWILMPRNVMLALLFVLTSFSFFTFGVNGIRNGIAIHLLLLGLALYLDGRLAWGVLCMVIAYTVHKSVVLPVASFFAAIYLVKSPKIAVYIWILSIGLSLVAGNFFTAFFAGFGFDDRMQQYLTTENANLLDNTTSKFHWDFLLYSAMPVLMTWVVIVKHKVTDNWYNVLAVTYCLANSFWVLVIRASFSNRFAYLSWFLYPVVIAYPLIMLRIWPDQDAKTGNILFGYVLLTLLISFFTGLL